MRFVLLVNQYCVFLRLSFGLAFCKNRLLNCTPTKNSHYPNYDPIFNHSEAFAEMYSLFIYELQTNGNFLPKELRVVFDDIHLNMQEQ